MKRSSVINSARVKTDHMDIPIHSEFVRNDTTFQFQAVVKSIQSVGCIASASVTTYNFNVAYTTCTMREWLAVGM